MPNSLHYRSVGPEGTKQNNVHVFYNVTYPGMRAVRAVVGTARSGGRSQLPNDYEQAIRAVGSILEVTTPTG
jgi:hypothetical protein